MARIELTNVTSGGGGGSTTLGLTTTGTSGASLLSPISGGYILNIPVYQGALTLTTTGSGAATLVGNTLNIPTPTSSTAAGSTGEVQYNGGSGVFAASSNLFWDSGNNRLGIGTNTPAQTLEVSGAMRLTGTAGTAAFMLGRSSAGDVSTVTIGTTGTSGAATLSANVLNIPQYQGAVSLTTTGTSGAATFAANTLNIPQYQGALTLTTSGTSGAATLVGNTLNIPQYSGGGGGTPAGNAGEVQFNSTPAGSFSASTAFVFDTAGAGGPFLKVGASAPSATVGINGSGTTSATTAFYARNSSSVDLLKVNDNGQFLLGKNGSGTTQSTASIEVSTTDTNSGIAIVPKGTGAITASVPNGVASGGNARGANAVDFQMSRTGATQVASGANSFIASGSKNTASGAGSFAFGEGCIASGSNSFAGGLNAVSSDQWSFAFGRSATASGDRSFAVTESTASGGFSFAAQGSVANATYSSSLGLGLAYLRGQFARASAYLSGAYSSQSSILSAMRLITGTSAAELTLDGTAPGAGTRLVLSISSPAPTNARIWNAIVQLTAVCSVAGGSVTVGESFIGTYNLGIKRIGATTSLVGTVQNMITAQADTNMLSSVVTITADDTNESLKIDFTPPTGANASTVIRVVATVYLTEVGY